MDKEIQLFLDYIKTHVESIHYPWNEPYNGHINDHLYIELYIDMNEWLGLYKANPKKKELKDQTVEFTTDELLEFNDMNVETFEDRTYQGTFKDYKLKTYGDTLLVIVKNFKKI